MRTRVLLAAALTALAVAAPAGSHTTIASWTTYDAEQRLTVGRFAAANAIGSATCLGTGAATGKVGTFTRKFKHFECKVHDKNFQSERQLVVHVRSETAFTPLWLTTKECGA